MTTTRRVEVLRWYTGRLRPGCWGVVAVLTEIAGGPGAAPGLREWAAYCGPVPGEDAAADALAIADWGAKLEEDVARVYAAGKEYAAWRYRR